MCLAVPARVVSLDGQNGVVELGGNRLNIRMALTPDVAVDEWVLVHAGFSIATIDTADALETWDYLKACYEGDASGFDQDAGSPRDPIAAADEGLAR